MLDRSRRDSGYHVVQDVSNGDGGPVYGLSVSHLARTFSGTSDRLTVASWSPCFRYHRPYRMVHCVLTWGAFPSRVVSSTGPLRYCFHLPSRSQFFTRDIPLSRRQRSDPFADSRQLPVTGLPV